MDDRHFDFYDSMSKIGLAGVIRITKQRIKELQKSNSPQSTYIYDHYHKKLEVLEAMYEEKFEED